MKIVILLFIPLVYTGCVSQPNAIRHTAPVFSSQRDTASAKGAHIYADHAPDIRHRREVQEAFAAGEAKATRVLYNAIRHSPSVDHSVGNPPEVDSEVTRTRDDDLLDALLLQNAYLVEQLASLAREQGKGSAPETPSAETEFAPGLMATGGVPGAGRMVSISSASCRPIWPVAGGRRSGCRPRRMAG